MTKIKIALAAALVAGTASAALAQGFDPNPANRYPAYAGANGAAPYMGVMPRGTLQSAPVRAYRTAPAQQFESRDVALPYGQNGAGSEQNGFDRAGRNVDSGTSN